MKHEARSKWNMSMTILKGKQSISLLKTYLASLLYRLLPDEAEQHEANVAELEKRRAGQSETSVDQKSRTLRQNEAIKALKECVVLIRRIVKSSLPPPDIAKAFGMGTIMGNTVNGSIAAGNIVIAGYNKYKEWSTKAGIVEADIEQLVKLQENVRQADDEQEVSKYMKKSKTMDKISLQRAVQDQITKISALGKQEFMGKDPVAASLFADLIPGSGKGKKPRVDAAGANT